MKLPSYMRPKYPVLLVAGLGGLFTVVNLASAQTWTPTSAPAQGWASIAASADGKKLVAAGGDYWDVAGYGHLQASPIYTSTDSGATWTATSAPTTSWISVASSADGIKLVATAGGHDDVGGAIYTSTNSGVTWTRTSATATNWTNWTSIASSADGTKLVATASHPYNYGVGRFGGPIYSSTNSGAT